jgi:ADP-heptose:LPS heptosyltransferase
LIIDPGMLGDSVHLLPAMWELRRHYQQAQLHVLCSPVGEQIHSLAGCVDRCWVLSQSRETRSLTTQLKLLRVLRRQRFDVSINFGTNDRNLIYARVIGARHRLGKKHDRWHFWSPWCIPDWVTVPSRGLMSYESRRQLLAMAGFPLEPAKFGISIPDDASGWAAANVTRGAIHFSLNASTPLREWPVAYWCELARKLLSANPDVRFVATGTDSVRERARLEALLAGAQQAGVQIFPGLPIARLAAVLARCRLHIGSDSGTMHLALALAKPTIGLFREFPGRAAWTPQGPEHRSFVVDCPCVGQKQPPCLPNKTAVCLQRITPDMVFEVAREQLSAFPAT